MTQKNRNIQSIDIRVIAFFNKIFIPAARFSLFLIFFWFGLIKLFGTSPASPLAEALTAKTVGIQYYDSLFIILALLECVIGIMFLLPKVTRIVIPLLLIHMLVVCSPLLLVPDYTWQSFLVPTLEGQYIIKNAVVVAIAIGIASSTKPLYNKK